MFTFQVPVGISNRHIHLTQEHIEMLFGSGFELTVYKPLSQPGQFAAEEKVDLIGPKGSITGVRVLGPARKESQVELSFTDTFKVGISAPVRDSGDLHDTPGIVIMGPKGEVELERGVIVAGRHIHMSEAEAKEYHVKDRDRVQVMLPGERGGIMDEVLIRVSKDFRLDFHIDTDEGNAFELKNGQIVNVRVSNDSEVKSRELVGTGV